MFRLACLLASTDVMERLFYIFTSQFVQLPFLRYSSGEAHDVGKIKEFTEDDDLDLCIYYLRTISNVFRWAPDAIWGILATKMVSPEDFAGLTEISKSISRLCISTRY